MQCNRFELELIGESYDIIKTSLIVLDANLIIKYTNKQAMAIFGEKNSQWIDKSLSEICRYYNIPNLITKRTYQVYSESVYLSNSYKKWQLSDVLIDGVKSFFLTDHDVTEIEQLHIILTDSLKEITGQSITRQENLLMYANEIHYCVKSIIAQMPGYIYWKDKNYKYVLANNNVVKSLGFESINDIIGKTDYDFNWSKKVVDGYRKLDKEVLESGIPKLNVEESVVTNEGKTLYLLTNKIPLQNQAGEITGILGINIDISVEREATALKLANYQAKIKAQERFSELINGVMNLAHNYKIDIFNDKLGLNNHNELVVEIKLSKREEQVLYFLSMGKIPKDIAIILSRLEGKQMSHLTVLSVISKQLYLKLDVSNTAQLIEKANRLHLVPFIPKSLSGFLHKQIEN
ncbi:MAG: PAS domain-containing protein [Neisseriaceae bacterium]